MFWEGGRLAVEGLCATPHPSFVSQNFASLEEKAFNCPHPSSVPLATFPKGKAFLVSANFNICCRGRVLDPSRLAKI